MCVSLLNRNRGKTITITKTVMKQTLDCKKYILLSVVAFPGADWVGHYYLTTGAKSNNRAKHQNCIGGITTINHIAVKYSTITNARDRRAVISLANMITHHCICIYNQQNTYVSYIMSLAPLTHPTLLGYVASSLQCVFKCTCPT